MSTDRLAVAARLVAKAVAAHGSVRVLTPDAATTDALDRLLWMVPATGFLPHCRMDSPLAAANAGVDRPSARARRPGGRARQPARRAAAVLQPLRAAGGNRRRRRCAGRPRALPVLSRARLRAARARHERTRHSAMPTARELLEQADALMRRNRADAVDDIPVLTDAVPIAEAPHCWSGRSSASAPTPARAGSDTDADGTRRCPSPRSPRRGWCDEGEPSDWLEIDERRAVGHRRRAGFDRHRAAGRTCGATSDEALLAVGRARGDRAHVGRPRTTSTTSWRSGRRKSADAPAPVATSPVAPTACGCRRDARRTVDACRAFGTRHRVDGRCVDAAVSLPRRQVGAAPVGAQ